MLPLTNATLFVNCYIPFEFAFHIVSHHNKVITTVVISLLDDRTYCSRSAFTILWGIGKGYTIVRGIINHSRRYVFSNVLY